MSVSPIQAAASPTPRRRQRRRASGRSPASCARRGAGWRPTTWSWRWMPSAMSAGTRTTPASARGSRIWRRWWTSSHPCSTRRASSSGFPATAIPSRIPTRSSTSRSRSANGGRPARRCDTGPGCRHSPTMPLAESTSAPTRSASRPRRPAMLAPMDGCCGIRATSIPPMTSSPSPSRPRLRQPTPRQLMSRLRRHADLLRLLVVGLICQAAVACATATTPASAAPPAGSAAVSSGQTAQAISAIGNEEIAAGHLVGGVVVLGIGDRIVLRQAYGQRSVTPDVTPATLDTIYDAASLTKVMATAVAIQQLVEQGKINLDQPAATYWPAFAANGKGAITVRQLMTHYAALPAGIPTRGWSDYQGALDAIVALKPVAPAGTRFNYSDVDFIVLGEIVRRVSGQPLETYAAQHIFQPLGMRDTTFLPSPSLRDRIAPADLEGSELRWGDVQDPIAYRMGGVAGHAGVFTTADDLTKFAQMMLAGGKNVLKPASVAAMTTPQSPPGGAALRGLGWDIDSPYAVWFAPSFSTHSYGHTGYTGTAIWADPETKTFLTVLTNRLHPDGKGNLLTMLRPITQAPLP